MANTRTHAGAVRCITQDGAVMALAMDSTAIAAEAERVHQTSAVITAGLGRLLTGASMMGIMLKNREDSLTLRINGGGPAGTLLAVADGEGFVRGYAENPVVEIPLRPDGKLDVGSAVGTQGQFIVIRDTGTGEPYNGYTPIATGEIAEDITHYYAQSEQIPTVCALGVLVNPDLTVRAAGGLLVQLLPFCPQSALERVEKNVGALASITALLGEGRTPEELCALALAGMPYDVLDTYEPAYRCTCSRQRVSGALAALTPEDRDSLPGEDGLAEVTCRFCDKRYTFTPEELKAL